MPWAMGFCQPMFAHSRRAVSGARTPSSGTARALSGSGSEQRGDLQHPGNRHDWVDRKLLGVHSLEEGVASIMDEAAQAVSAGMSTETLASAIHPHPTLSKSFGWAASLVPANGLIA